MSRLLSIKEYVKDLIWGPQKMQESIKQIRKELVDHKGPPIIYNIPMEEEQIKIDGCKRFSVGKDSLKSNHTVMVLGATGAGKTTLINGMINYVLGVQWEDSFRFKLVDEDQSKSQAESQTSEVTVYKINYQEGFHIDYSLTIVDTPGFGDTRGIERDRLIEQQLNKLFNDPHGVSDIDAVCFVAQASLARLTKTQQYVFDSVLSIFGKNIAENIRILVTFADGQCPLVLEAIKAADVPCQTKNGQPLHFKFNNSALFADNKSPAANSKGACDDEEEEEEEDHKDGSFDEMFWKMGFQSMKKFFKALKQMPKKSLNLTKEVLRERQTLENSVETLQKLVKVGLANIEERRQKTQILETHKAEIARNKNFKVITKYQQAFQNNKTGFNTNCQQCNLITKKTCHDSCAFGNDGDKARCIAMGIDGYCKECLPNKCHWSAHFNLKYVWDYKEVTTTETVTELFVKHQTASKAKMSVEDLIAQIRAEYVRLLAEVLILVKRSAKCLDRLKEISLKPNPLSTPEYIDMLIEAEKFEAKEGFMERMNSLKEMRKNAETKNVIIRLNL